MTLSTTLALLLILCRLRLRWSDLAGLEEIVGECGATKSAYELVTKRKHLLAGMYYFDRHCSFLVQLRLGDFGAEVIRYVGDVQRAAF